MKQNIGHCPKNIAVTDSDRSVTVKNGYCHCEKPLNQASKEGAVTDSDRYFSRSGYIKIIVNANQRQLKRAQGGLMKYRSLLSLQGTT